MTSRGPVYTCPMHPQVRQAGPGSCLICGMALEPERPTTAEEANPELVDFSRRFWCGLALTLPVLALETGGHLTGLDLPLARRSSNWIQLAFGTPVVLWAGWPFFTRGWRSRGGRPCLTRRHRRPSPSYCSDSSSSISARSAPCHLHTPIQEQGSSLRHVMLGYFAYHAVPTNGPSLCTFRHHVAGLWFRALRQRSQRQKLTWSRMMRVRARWLLVPRILHPWPTSRFATHSRRKPDALIGPVRFCAGDAS